MSLRRPAPTLLLVPLLAASAALRAQTMPKDTQRVVTRDGSVFFLVPRTGRGVTWWASFVRMGRVHEPPGREGLAEACVRASLFGTRSHGTSDPDKEAEALAALDRIEHRVREAERSGVAAADLAKLRKTRGEAAAAAHELGDLLRFGRLLEALPASRPRVRSFAGGTLLSVAVPPSRLADLATLMEARRREPVLRGFGRVFRDVRRALRRRLTARAGTQLRQACLLALSLHPARRVLVPPAAADPFVSRLEALAFYRRHVRPRRGVTVLAGAFDPAKVAAMLRRVFVHDGPVPAGGPAGLPDEPAQTGTRSVEVKVPGPPELVLAWRIPRGTPAADLEVLAMLLANGAGADLPGKLVHERGVAEVVRARPHFPLRRDPSLFVLELIAPNAAAFGALVTETDAYLGRLAAAGPAAAACEHAVRRWKAAWRRQLDDPRALAEDLALRLGASATRQPSGHVPDAAAVCALAKSLFDPSRLTRVASKLVAAGAAGPGLRAR